jgi:hypothetical protein
MWISWTQKAIVNLDSAVEYIAADSPAAASRVAQKIWNTACSFWRINPALAVLAGWLAPGNLLSPAYRTLLSMLNRMV